MAPSSSIPPRAPLTRERIVRSARALVDEDGLDALSMRTLAQRMGTRPMSLYRHVADKDDLLAAIAAAMLAEIPPTPSGTLWQEELRAWAIGFRAVARRHPHAVPLLARRPVTSYAAGRVAAESGLEMLEGAGFEARTAGLVLRGVVRYVVGFSLAGTAPAPDAAPAMIDALRAEGFPRLARMAERAGTDAEDELFLLGLDALLAGLSLRLHSGASSVPAGAGSGDEGAARGRRARRDERE